MIVLLQLITQSVRKKTWHQTSYLVSSEVCIIIKRFFSSSRWRVSVFCLNLEKHFYEPPKKSPIVLPSKLRLHQLMRVYRSAVRVMRKQAEEQQWVRALQPRSDSQCELRLSRVSCSGSLNNHAQFDEFSSFTVWHRDPVIVGNKPRTNDQTGRLIFAYRRYTWWKIEVASTLLNCTGTQTNLFFLDMLAAFNPDGKISLSISVDILRRHSSSPEDKFHDLGDPPTSL